MAKRRVYVRDSKGRFARTNGLPSAGRVARLAGVKKGTKFKSPTPAQLRRLNRRLAKVPGGKVR